MKNWPVYLIATLFFAVLIAAIFWLGNWEQNREADRQRELEFKGACTVLEGEVHDDLCVNDGVVLIDHDDYERAKKS